LTVWPVTSYDHLVERQVEQIRTAHRDAAAAFFCACAERFVPLYEAFCDLEQWGDPVLLRQTLDQAWAAVSGGPASALDARPDILALTPHADDFDSIETTFAQDAAALVDAAAAAAGSGVVAPDTVHAAFESLRTAATYAQTGYLDLGDTPEGAELERTIGDHPLIRTELALQEADLADLTKPLDRVCVERLRARAVANRWTTAKLLADRPPS
jgi:uncharacterized protein YjaG (DUF416 family)